MDRYLIQIGGRELEVVSDSAQNAVDAALRQYPGEVATGWGYLGPYLGVVDACLRDEPSEAPETGGEAVQGA